MKEWLKISVFLCTFGVLKEFRPSDPFLIDFLVGEWRNITQEQINRDAVPVGTYSYLAQLVIIFLVTDFFRYKPLIILGSLAGIAIWCLLLWTKSLFGLQAVYFLFGNFMATEVAYYTYIYAKVDREHYQKVTSHTRAAILVGRFLGGALSQILVNLKLMDFRELNYITLVAQIVATIWVIFLPRVRTSLYFNRGENETTPIQSNRGGKRHSDFKSDVVQAFNLLVSQFVAAYTNRHVVLWSIWYAMGMCGYLQTIWYIQVVWSEIGNSQEVNWNGAVEAVATLAGAIMAIAAGYIQSTVANRNRILLLVAVLTILTGGALFLTCLTTERMISYVGYLLFYILYSFSITIASAEIANHLIEDSFGMVFGINTLVALVAQTILTLVVISEDGLAFTIMEQFMVYAYWYVTLGVLYLIYLLVNKLFGFDSISNNKADGFSENGVTIVE